MMALDWATHLDAVADEAFDVMEDEESTHQQRCKVLAKFKPFKARPPRRVKDKDGNATDSYVESRQVFFEHFANLLGGEASSFEQVIRTSHSKRLDAVDDCEGLVCMTGSKDQFGWLVRMTGSDDMFG